VSLDELSDLAVKLLPIGGAVAMLWGLMRWLYGIGVKRQLENLRADILRALPEAVRAGVAEHEARRHDEDPPPLPTWVPRPNGDRPASVARHRYRS
jgi:hypothetical protein